MAVMSMAYDHPAYTARELMGGEIAAAASSKTTRFAAYTAMTIKSMQATVITAGGTANGINLVRQAAGGTALTTMASIASTFGTGAGGLTTNVLMTSTFNLAAGDVVWAEKGSADGTGVYAIAFEMVVVPGANLTT